MQKIVKDILKKYIGHIIILIIFMIINMYILTLPPKIVGKIIDLLYDIENNKVLINQYIIYLMITVCILLLTRTPWRTLASYISRAFEKDIKDKLFDHFMRVKMNNIQNIKNGEWMSYFTKDIGELKAFLYRVISYATRVVIISIIAIYTMAQGIDLKLTLITLCPIIVTVYAVIKLKQYLENSFRKSQTNFTNLSQYVQESTDGIRTIKAYTGETYQLKDFIRKNRQLKQSNNTVDVFSTLLSVSINVGFGICYGISLILGSKLVLEGKISIGDFTAFNGYIALFYGPVSWMPTIISRYKRAQISFRRLDRIFKLEKEKITSEITKENTVDGDIVIHDLSFNYPSNIEVALSNINIVVRKGETLGIIGTIGSGKTTLMNLLIKLYPVPNGKILIGGKDINEIETTDLRRSMCYITQDNFLFSSTLKDNISLFNETYKEDEIKDSAKDAIIYDDIETMQDNIYTIIGERGIDLSGGQKQRVAISRAFLKKSNFVIFDDTFSALDNRTEEKLLKNVKELTKGKTCIIISNRISDIKAADKIIVLDSGKIVQFGNHQSLINQDGLYNEFYKQQSSKDLEFLA